MKKIILLLALAFVFQFGKSQNGHSCDSALTIPSGNTTYTVSLDTSDMWFEWSNVYNMTTVDFSFDTASSYQVTYVEIYKGTCSTNTLIAIDSVGHHNYSDTIFTFDLNLIDSNTHFIFRVKSTIPSGGGTISSKIVPYNYPSSITCSSSGGAGPLPCDKVCNGSLETGSCPTATGAISNANCWSASPYWSGFNSPDYFSSVASCAPPFVLAPTSNFCPYVGTRMGGIYVYDPTGNVGREYAQNHIATSMVAGMRYYVKFWVASRSYKYKIDAIGAYITNMPISIGNGYYQATPQISNPSGVSHIIADNCSTNVAGTWTKVAGCYTANGLEQYITIGNFLDNSAVTSTTVTCPVTATPAAYMFFDKLTAVPIDADAGNDATIACGGTVTIGTQTCTPDPDVTFSWAPTTGLGSPTTVTTTASPTVTTTYTLTIHAGTSCTFTDAVTITVTTPTLTASASPSTFCAPGSTTLTVTGSATTYTWSANAGSATTTTVAVTPTVTTTYTVTGSLGTCTASAVVTVTVNPTPTITVNSPTMCQTQQTTLTATGATSYTWTPSSSLSAPTGATVTATPSVTTVYTVTGTNSAGCTSSKTCTVTVNPAPTMSVTPMSPICTDSYPVTATLTLTTTNVSTYTWTIPTPPTGLSCTSNPCLNPDATMNSAGQYTFVVNGTSSQGCAGTGSVVVTINQIPTVSITPASTIKCPGATTTLTASGASTYTWSANAGSATTSTVAVSPTVTTQYTVLATGSNGCIGSQVATVSVYSVTTPVFSGTLCAGVTGTLSVGPSAGYTYTWTPSTGTNSVSPSTGTVVTVNNPSGTYTVAGTYTAGNCPVTNTYTTKPLPTVSISSAPTNSYCANAVPTVTLTASGASTYTWSANAGGGTSSTATVSPSTTTVYSVTGTSTVGCSNSATKTITIVPVPTLTVTANPTIICSGSSSTLTATGANSYTWTPSGSLSSSTGATVTATPTVTTTYTVSGTASSGCIGNSTITLTVSSSVPINLSTSSYTACNYAGTSGTTTVCSGVPITFTASSSGQLSTYTWTPGSVTGAVATFTPSITQVYTVTGSGSGGCSGTTTSTVTVSNCLCTGTSLPTLTSTTITGGSYVLNASTSVSGTVVLSGVSIKMAPGITITVPNGAFLDLHGCHISACNTMWQGFVVDPGGKLNLTSNLTTHCLIEDAIVAIDNNPSNTVQTGSPSIIQVSQSVFNCNRTAIRRAYYQSTTASNYGTANFKVTDAVVTCRCSLAYPLTTGTLTVYSNTVTNTPNAAAPDLSDYYSVQNWTSANLKPPVPYMGAPAYEGVHLENNGDPVQQTTSRVYFQNVVGSSSLVLFDNLQYGIVATNATLVDTNCAFQNPRTTGAGTFFNPYVGGYGISASNNNTSFWNGLYVKNSRFINMRRAVYSSNYFDFDISNNVMWSNISAPSSGQFALSTIEDGVYISTPRYEQAIIGTNNIADFINGIVVSISNTSGYVSGGNGQYVGGVYIRNNTLGDVFSGNSYSGRLMGTAISVSNVLTPSSTSTVTPTTGAGSFIYVQNNTINNAWNGVYLSNHQWQKVRTEQNTITMKYQPTLGSDFTQYGIEHANCFYSSGASGAFGNSIWTNTLTCNIYNSSTTFSSSNQAAFETKKGIVSASNGNHYVTCNNVNYFGRAFEWQGTHMPNSTYWAKNIMTHNGEGHCLISNGSIGTQSTMTSGTANDNQWTSTSNTFADTYVDGSSSAANGILWVQTFTTPYGPTNNGGLSVVPYSYPVYLVSGKSACSYSCAAPPTSRLAGENSRAVEQDSVDFHFWETVVLDSIHYVSHPLENGYIDKNNAYRAIRRDSKLLGSPILNNFYNSNSSSGWAIFCDVEDALSTGNYSYALSTINGYTGVNQIEQNYKSFYRIYASSMQGNYSQADSLTLVMLANSCPMLNGTVVYQARALRNSLMEGFENYEDNCLTNNSNEKKTIVKEIKNGQSLTIYPNPSNGKLSINGFASTDKIASVEVVDVAGKIVSKGNFPLVNGTVDLVFDLYDGVYFVKCFSNGIAYPVRKVIISK